VNDRARTHGAGLKADPQIAAVESFVAQNLRRGANRQHFGMGRGVTLRPGQIMGGRNNHPVLDHNRANRHFSGAGSALASAKARLIGVGSGQRVIKARASSAKGQAQLDLFHESLCAPTHPPN
jgi:hypothetical protein